MPLADPTIVNPRFEVLLPEKYLADRLEAFLQLVRFFIGNTLFFTWYFCCTLHAVGGNAILTTSLLLIQGWWCFYYGGFSFISA